MKKEDYFVSSELNELLSDFQWNIELITYMGRPLYEQVLDWLEEKHMFEFKRNFYKNNYIIETYKNGYCMGKVYSTISKQAAYESAIKSAITIAGLNKEEERFEKGQLVYVSDYENPKAVVCAKFLFKDEEIGAYRIELSNGSSIFKYCWSKNPLIEEKERGIIIKQRVDGQLVNTHIEEKKEFKPEMGKMYYMWNDINGCIIRYVLHGIDKKGRYIDNYFYNRWNNISETNPLESK